MTISQPLFNEKIWIFYEVNPEFSLIIRHKLITSNNKVESNLILNLVFSNFIFFKQLTKILTIFLHNTSISQNQSILSIHRRIII